MATVSILVVNYNGRAFVGDLLASLARQTLAVDEVVVLDNASTDGSADYLRARFPWVKLICSTVNTGFAQGNNLALAHARGEYVALLNPDTVVAADCLAELVRVLESDDRIAVTTARILRPDRSPPLESAGAQFNNLGYYVSRYLHEANRLEFERPTTVAAMSACAMLLRRSALGGEALFDPDFFLCGEELELSLRLLARGYRIVAVPTARVEHRGSLSVRTVTRKSVLFHHFYFQRNRIKVLTKYYPVGVLLRGLPLILASLVYWNGRFLLNGGPRLLARALATQADYARRGLAERRSHGVDARGWLPWMSHHGLRDMLRLRAVLAEPS
jgi:GT2 family glycosyltransferase